MSLNKKRLKAAIFDMDGVITNTMPDHYRAWSRVFHEAGIPLTREEIYLREGQQGARSLREIFSVKGKSCSKRQLRKMLDDKEAMFKRIVKVRFIPGARQWIKALHRHGVRLALVTGTSRHEMQRILPKSLREMFDVIITGNDVRHGKPDPEPYRKAVRKLGISAREGIVVENAPLGIQSATAAGLACYAISTSLPRRYLHGAKKVFPTIKALRAHVAFFSNGNGV